MDGGAGFAKAGRMLDNLLSAARSPSVAPQQR